MTYNTFVERKAQVTVTVTRNSATGPQQSTYVYTQNRMRIGVRLGGAQMGNACVEIFGVPLADMNNIAKLWLMPNVVQNSDTLSIDVWDGNVYIPFFSGVITWSAVNGGSMPLVSMTIEANSAMAAANMTASPYANPGPVALQDALSSIITPAGFVLDYSQLAGMPQYICQDIRLTGTPEGQVADLLSHYPDLRFHYNLQRLRVYQATAPYDGNVVIVDAASGLMKLPIYSTTGVQFDTIFNPLLTLGTACQFNTDFTYLNNAQWAISVLSHAIEPNVPGGQWTSSAACIFWNAGNSDST